MQIKLRYRFLLFAALAIAALFSCKEEGPVFTDHTPQVEPVDEVFFNISEKNIYVATPDSAVIRIQIFAQNVEWVITGVPDWIKITPMSGSGDTDVTIICSANKDITPRQGVFMLSGRNNGQQLKEITVGVSQPRCAERYAKVDRNEYVFNGTPTDTLISVNTNTDDFRVEVTDGLKEWCSVTADIKGHSISIRTLYINKDRFSKEGYFHVVTSDSRQSVKLVQRPLDAVSYGATVEFSVKGGRKSVTVNGECLERYTSNDWIESAVSVSGSHTEVLVTTTRNYSVSERYGFVYLTLSDGSLMEIPVHQKGVTFNIGIHSLSVKSYDCDTILYIASNVPWRFDDIEADWITVDPMASDTAGQVSVRLARNRTMNDRSTSVSVYPELLKDLKQTIEIHQEGVTFNVDTAALMISCNKDTIEFAVNTDDDWTASSPEDWISVYPESGYGNGVIQVRIEDNPSIESREGTVKIAAGGKTESVKVHQDGIQLTVSPEISFDSRGGTVSLSVHTNTGWIIAAQDEWIEVSRNNLKGDGSFLVSVSDNPSVNPRSGSIVFRSENTGRQFRFDVYQKARYLNVLADSVEFFAKGGKSDNITIETDGVAAVESLDTWISVEKVSDELFTVSASRNDAGVEREGKVRVSLSDLTVGSLVKEIVITQAAPYFSVAVDSIIFSYESGQSKPIIINTDGLTEIITDLDWITVTKESETKYLVTSKLYEGSVERSGIVTVALKDLSSLFSNDITVVQEPPRLEVSTDSLHFYYKGGTSQPIAVNANGELVTSTDADWLTVTQKGAGSYTVTASQNYDDTIRTGTISIRLKDTDAFSKVIKVTQDFDDPDKRYGYVDLGLSVLWADRNLGAEAPEQNGNSYKWSNYYNDAGLESSNGTNDLSYVVSFFMGSDSYLPSGDEIQELIDKCNWAKTTVNGQNGYTVASNGNTLFIPYGSYCSDEKNKYYSEYNSLTVDQDGVNKTIESWSKKLFIRGVRPYSYHVGQTITSIVLSDNKLDLNLGDTYTFKPLFKDDTRKIINAPFNCVSDDESVCVVGDNGKITAIAPGRCNIKISSGSAADVFCTVDVSIPEIKIKQESISLAIGETFTLQVQARNNGVMTDAPNEWFEWTSDYERIATVNSDGVVTGASFGFCNITAKCGNVQSTCKISIQEPEPYCEPVDMGLSVKWGNSNIGAVSYSDIGGLYAWGETSIKEDNSWDSYKWCNYTSGQPFFTKYCQNSSDGFKDNKTVLEASDDVATVKLGEGWRMPTLSEFKELLNNCTLVSVSSGGMMLKLTSNITGNQIYLPYEHTSEHGYTAYWTSSLKEDNDKNANAVSPYYNTLYYNSFTASTARNILCAVRPVFEVNEPILITDLEINHSSLTFVVGDTLTLRTTVKRGDYTIPVLVDWTSTDHTVATVSDGGQVTAVSDGTCKIIATYENLHDTCIVQVGDSYLSNGHGYVDLGLSVLWATANVGGDYPEEYGNYYAWGETEPKSNYNWSTYIYCNGTDTVITKYNSDNYFGSVVDNKTVLESEDDVAHVVWGGDWRIPTKEEFSDLINNCTWTWTTENGISGYLITSKIPGYTDRSVFLPAAGQYYDRNLQNQGTDCAYWTSSRVTISGESNRAWVHGYDYKSHGLWMYYRCHGRPVRPVLRPYSGHEGVRDDDDLYN